LANMGDDSKETVTAIARNLRNPQTSGVIISTVIMVRPRAWMNDEIISEIIKPFGSFTPAEDGKQTGRYFDLSQRAVVLGLLGERAASAAGKLETVQESAIADQRIEGVILTLALARVVPDRRGALLRRLLKSFRTLVRGPAGVLVECPYLLIDEKLSEQLAQALEDPDRDVAEVARYVFWWAGLSARDAFPRVLKYVRDSADSNRRAKAAGVLGMISTFARLPELEAALKEEKSEAVRRQLQAAIEGVRSLNFEFPLEDEPGP
jgi:hypothetical protein